MHPRINLPALADQPARRQLDLRGAGGGAIAAQPGTHPSGLLQLLAQRIRGAAHVRLVQPRIHQGAGLHRLLPSHRGGHDERGRLGVDHHRRVRAQEADVTGVHQAQQLRGAEGRRPGAHHLAHALELRVGTPARLGGEPAGLVHDGGGLAGRTDGLQPHPHRRFARGLRLGEVLGQTIGNARGELVDALARLPGLLRETRDGVGVIRQVKAAFLGHQPIQAVVLV